ncbi:hypothetical protein ACWDSD_39045 [Streptomyces spiralis]
MLEAPVRLDADRADLCDDLDYQERVILKAETKGVNCGSGRVQGG